MEAKQKIIVVVTMLALVGLLGPHPLALAGNLEPNSPPGPTMKTLDQVEPRIPISDVPYTVSASGSYYLTADLQLSDPNGTAINVEANNISIDLMGYSLIGPGKATGTNYGILMHGRNNVEVCNGTVRGFGSCGVYEGNVDAQGHRFIRMRAVSNGSHGIYLAGKGHLVKDCTAADNGGYGIVALGGSTVTGNTAYNNVRGIWASRDCTVAGNTAHNNAGSGIHAIFGCTVTGNTSYNNTYGFYADGWCTLTGNTARNNQYCGIIVWSGNTVIGNTVCNNNLADDDFDAGITVAGGGCLIKGNTLRENLQNNLYIMWHDNAIEENLVTGSFAGIHFDEIEGTGNFYANNRASDNIVDYFNTAGQTDGGGNYSF